MGRHGLLCFAHRYSIETWRDGQSLRVDIAAPVPSTPFGIDNEARARREAQGTRISVAVRGRLPDAGQIRSLLAATFLHDSRFIVRVNGESVAAADLSGSVDRVELKIEGGPPVVVGVIDATRAGRGASHAGISFWVNGRRVGTPSWIINGESLVDAHGHFARRYAIVVQAGEGWLHEVEKAWREFKRGASVLALHIAVRDYLRVVLDQLGGTVSEESSEDALRCHRAAFGMLTPMQRAGVATFTLELVKATPAVSPTLDPLSGDPRADELQVLHPLVAQSRWLFGAEFDSAEYVSNVSLRTAAEKIFKKRLSPMDFSNHRKRPDLVMLADATCCVVGTEGFGPGDERLIRQQKVLLVELKRGGHVLQRVDLWQTLGYLDDFYRCGALDGPSQLTAFVVGHAIGEDAQLEMPFMAGGLIRGSVRAVTYGQLTRSAHCRLLQMKDRIPARYEEMSGADLSARIMRTAQPEST